MNRVVQPEILDALPQHHPTAMHNRRDLLWLNRIMGSFRWFKTQLNARLRSEDHVLELGAGSGDLGVYAHEHLRFPPQRWSGIDIWSRPEDWPVSWNWYSGNLLDFPDYKDCSVIIGNLILHQFEDQELQRLGAIWNRHARVLLFNEPARRNLHIYQLQLTRLLGMHPITRHDGIVSIRAGFLGRELPSILGLDHHNWSWALQTTAAGNYRLAAQKFDSG